MIVLVTGGRDYNDREKLHATLAALHKTRPIQILIHGCATGADSLAAAWAMNQGIHTAGVPPIWDVYARLAGTRRNGAMLLLKPELVIAFPGGRGTANMVAQARYNAIKVIMVDNSDLVKS
jgi:predicted Rossmann-fold nucleotide-binding protein